MLKELEIKNFKSIGYAKFDLGRINVLTGQSNLGKSNVVQAIYCLAHNHWDSNYLKWGEKKCSICLTDENGEWVEYSHGSDSSAEYRLSTVETPFTKIGRDVPVPVRDFLKMNQVQFDDDLSLDFNFERQFDPSFVISLSGFELAKVFGKLMNLDIVLSAARDINKDLGQDRKLIDGQEAVENVSIEYIQNNYRIELKYALLHQALEIDAGVDELDRKNSALQSVLSDIEYYQECANVYESFLTEKSDLIDSVSEPVPGLDNVLVNVLTAQEAVRQYSSVLAKEMPLFDYDAFQGLYTALYGLVSGVSVVSIYSGLLEKVGAVDFDLVQGIFDKKSVLDLVVQNEVDVRYLGTNLKNKETEITKKTNEFKQYLKVNNVCPISGRPFLEGCMESIVESV